MRFSQGAVWALAACFSWGVFGCASLEEQVRGEIEYILPTQEAQPGDVVKFTFQFPERVKSGKVIFLDKTYDLFPRKDLQGAMFTAFMAVPWETVPGDYAIDCSFQVEGLNQNLRESFPFQIVPIVHPAVPERVKSKAFNANQWAQDYRVLAESLRKGGYKSIRFQGFILPLSGQIRAVFGTERIYNAQDKVIIAGLEIEPLAHGNTWDVTSAAEGKVLLAQKFPMLGNVVLVDHGFSFVSMYAHLNTMQVKEGQNVTRGAKLGRAGKTGGAAVGNRLLFQVFVAGIPVNVKKIMDIATH